jgi:hypothetical protein
MNLLFLPCCLPHNGPPTSSPGTPKTFVCKIDLISVFGVGSVLKANYRLFSVDVANVYEVIFKNRPKSMMVQVHVLAL